jgi:hypothetical protein
VGAFACQKLCFIYALRSRFRPINKAAQNNGKVLSATVSLRTAVCPECGTVYTAGGTTTTKISYSDESNPYQQNKKSADAAAVIGRNLDLSA